MSGYPRSPKLVRGGLVLLDPGSGVVLRTIALQYNPDSLTRTLQVQGAGTQGGDRLEALRLKGPASQLIKLEIEFDAGDALERPDLDPAVGQIGLHAQLAALEAIVYPPSARLQANATLAGVGTLEIAPVEAPLTVFVWSRDRILPVRITELSITEEAFDASLNPIRARVSLGLHVLSVNDLPFSHRGASLYMVHQQHQEQLAARAPHATLGALGITGIG